MCWRTGCTASTLRLGVSAAALWQLHKPTMDIQDHKQALPPSFRLGNYRVVRVLGAGGFGITYLCEQRGSGVRVAVKEYLPSDIAVRTSDAVVPKSPANLEEYAWGLDRFLAEARTLARFEHRNVVRVHGCFEANGTAYIVMEYEDGEPLDSVLERTGTLNEAQLKHLLLPVVAGLQSVHAADFLHRDVKPANIFIRRSDDSPVLLDFGAARQAMGQLSQSVTAIASAGYSPPEQYEKNGKQGPWTDIYALSALCYRAIMGEAPVEAPRRLGQLLRGEGDPLPRLADIAVRDYAATFLLAVDHGLRVLETERPQSLAKWRQELTGRTVAIMGTDELSLVFGDLAQRREPQNQTILGTESGNTVGDDRQQAEDDQQVAQHYRKAAEEGDVWAQTSLGQLHQLGQGVALDDRQAAVWYRKAAEQGFAPAQYHLGALYDFGEGVVQDHRQAALWYGKAAEQGFAHAQDNLGTLFKHGRGVAQDDRQAAFWFREAAEQGHAEAQNNIGVMYKRGRGVAQDERRAALWFRMAAEQGDAAAQNNLGVMFFNGTGVPRDVVQGYAWLSLPSAQALSKARPNLEHVERTLTRSQIAEGQRLGRELAAEIEARNETL